MQTRSVPRRLLSLYLVANSPNQRDNLETRRNHLRFTVVLDTQHVDSKEWDAEDRDPDGGVEV